jgi:hypothetical protein
METAEANIDRSEVSVFDVDGLDDFEAYLSDDGEYCDSEIGDSGFVTGPDDELEDDSDEIPTSTRRATSPLCFHRL